MFGCARVTSWFISQSGKVITSVWYDVMKGRANEGEGSGRREWRHEVRSVACSWRVVFVSGGDWRKIIVASSGFVKEIFMIPFI